MTPHERERESFFNQRHMSCPQCGVGRLSFPPVPFEDERAVRNCSRCLYRVSMSARDELLADLKAADAVIEALKSAWCVEMESRPELKAALAAYDARKAGR